MNTKLILTSIVIFFTNVVFAQAPVIQWEKTYGGERKDYANSIQPTSDGGYIVAGRSNSWLGDITGNLGIDDYWIVKISSNGTMQWQKSLGGNHTDIANSIKPTPDGGYIVAGSSKSNNINVTGNHGNEDYWIVKLNSSGTIEWQKSYGGSGADMAYDIQLTSDGGYIVAGSSDSNNGDVTGNHGDIDYWIVKLSSSGVILWQKSLGGSGDENARSIQITPDGGYIVAGSSDSDDGDVTGNHGDYRYDDYWIVKLTTNGVIEWQKSLGGTNHDIAQNIKSTSDGGYIVVGYSYSYNGDATYNYGSSDYWVVKLNNSGAVQWQKSFGGSNSDYAYCVSTTLDGGYIVGGETSSAMDGLNGGSDSWILKLSSSGAVQWRKNLGELYNDWIKDIHQLSDGSYILAGTIGIYYSDKVNYRVIKLNPDTLTTQEIVAKDKVLIENPVKDLLKITSNYKITSLLLYDATGQLVKISNSQNMSVKEFPKGIYILKIQLENGKTISEKIIKE